MRHFAYYRQDDGAYLAEQLAPVNVPAEFAALPESVRALAIDRWANAIACPAPGVVALDVTRFDYPLGDFCWSVLRFGDGENGRPLLDWPHMHTFVQLDRFDARIVAWNQSPRPVRSTADRLILDVTGTAWAAAYGTFGQFWDLGNGRFNFEPDEALTPPALMAAAPDLNPFDLTPERVMVEAR